jgi:hypothetical protein
LTQINGFDRFPLYFGKKTHNRNVKIAGLKQKQKRDINFKTTLRNFNSYFEILNKKVTKRVEKLCRMCPNR